MFSKSGYVYGTTGNDTYLYNKGHGSYEIIKPSNAIYSTNNIISISGYIKKDVYFSSNYLHVLKIAFLPNSNDYITVDNFFNSDGKTIFVPQVMQKVQFPGGSYFDLTKLISTNPLTFDATPTTNSTAIVGKVFEQQLDTSSFTDLDKNSTVYSLKSQDGTALPSWINFDTSTGKISGTPASASTYYLTLGATDNTGKEYFIDIAITSTVKYKPIVLKTKDGLSISHNSEISYQLSNVFKDPNNDALNFTAKMKNGDALPSWLTFLNQLVC